MSKNIKIKGYICQVSWEDVPCLQPASQESEYMLTHREIEVEVPIASLRFNPIDTDSKIKILALNAVKCKEKEIADNVVKNEKLKKEIQELLALEAPAHCVAPSPFIDFDEDIPF